MQKKYNITIPPDSGAIFKDYDQTVLRPNFPIPVQIDEVVIKYFEIFTGLVILNYSNRNIDLLLEEARLTNDQETRDKKYREFQDILIEDLPAIFLYTPTYTYPVNKKIKGVEIERLANPHDRFRNIENWYVKTKKKFFN